MLCRRQGLLFRLNLISRFKFRNAVSEEQILHVADVAGEADPCARLSPGKSTLSCPRITVIVGKVPWRWSPPLAGVSDAVVMRRGVRRKQQSCL